MATTLSKIVPCIWLDNQAEPAAAFYARVFPAGRVIAASRYPARIDNPGGRHGPCGWLKDRFGLSWQVVPQDIARWLTAPDEAARERMLAVLWKVQKIDIAALRRAFKGK